jgi:hypothetical protein
MDIICLKGKIQQISLRKLSEFDNFKISVNNDLVILDCLIIFGLNMVPLNKRKNPLIIQFIINRVLTYLNDYTYFAATRRYYFRLGETKTGKVINHIPLKPNEKILEIFGNIPLISFVSTYLGLEATVIDFHYTQKVQTPLYIVNKALKICDTKGNKEKDVFLQSCINDENIWINDDLNFKMINITEIKKSLDFIPNLNDNLTFTNADLTKNDIDLTNNFFDYIFIDPPFMKNTQYQEQKLEKLLNNSLILAYKHSNLNTLLYIRLPDKKVKQYLFFKKCYL